MQFHLHYYFDFRQNFIALPKNFCFDRLKAAKSLQIIVLFLYLTTDELVVFYQSVEILWQDLGYR